MKLVIPVSFSFATFCLVLILNSCLVSRTVRPLVTGYIYDAHTKVPLPACRVGETFTDSIGYYELDEKRRLQFTLPGIEAPAVLVTAVVTKDGYENDSIFGYNPFGGGLRRGTTWTMDTIFLERIKD